MTGKRAREVAPGNGRSTAQSGGGSSNRGAAGDSWIDVDGGKTQIESPRTAPEVGGSWHSFLVSGGGSGGYSNAQDTGTMDMSLYIDPYDEAELAAQKIAMGGGHLDDGLIEAKKEKTLQKLYKNNPLLASNIAPFGFRCPFCPDRRTPGWTWTVLLDHATAYGKPGRYTYKVAGVHQALVDYMVLPMP